MRQPQFCIHKWLTKFNARPLSGRTLVSVDRDPQGCQICKYSLLDGQACFSAVSTSAKTWASRHSAFDYLLFMCELLSDEIRAHRARIRAHSRIDACFGAKAGLYRHFAATSFQMAITRAPLKPLSLSLSLSHILRALSLQQ